MNYILTKKCNKGCPYCFAAEVRNEDPNSVMPLETFKNFVHKYSGSVIKLLGGEPTQHPQFKEIVEFLTEEHRSFVLISNFLFKEDILNCIINALNKVRINFLINATDLDKNNRLSIWKKNYNTLYNYLYEKNLEENISIGITLYRNNSAEYYIQYLQDILTNITKIERLRISINFPGNSSSKNPREYIKDYDTGFKIICLIRWCLNNGIVPSLDCCLYPCMFKNKEEFKYVKKFMNNFHSICGKHSGNPTDLFPNGEVAYCYPLKKVTTLDSKNYKNIEEIREALFTSYRILTSLAEIPEDCKNCAFYKSGVCAGPNMCHFNFENLKLPEYK